jgi:hypothetical protein
VNVSLIPHPHTPCPFVTSLTVHLHPLIDGSIELRYSVRGDIGRLHVPARKPARRTDELWQDTCFEAFVRTGQRSYQEFNFAPSRQWAAYEFDAYRHGMRPLLLLDKPSIVCRTAVDTLTLDATLASPIPVPGIRRIALCAVLKDDQGAVSYWALAHAPDKPDFHHEASFALDVPAAETAA